MDFTQLLNFSIGLFVVANPLSALAGVLKVTRNQSLEQKRKIGFTASSAVALIFLITTWFGTPLLKILGIQLPAFQITGGCVIFIMAFSMLYATSSPIKQTEAEEKEKLPAGESGAIVPLAIPIIAGPGTISTIIVYLNDFPGLWNQILISICGVLVAFAMGIILHFASKVEKVIGTSGINIINRLGGLILAAIAIQTMADGLMQLFPVLK